MGDEKIEKDCFFFFFFFCGGRWRRLVHFFPNHALESDDKEESE